MTKIKPLEDRILVEHPKTVETITASGIIIPELAQPTKGFRKSKITHIGPDCSEAIQVGDLVLYGEYAGSDFEFEGVKYLILRETELAAIIE